MLYLYFVIRISKGGYIKQTATEKKHFAPCNNSSCKAIFLVDPVEDMGELGFLCNHCKDLVDKHHVVQCASCKSIVHLLSAANKEDRVVFYVEKCSHCIGTEEDDWEFEPYYQPESYI